MTIKGFKSALVSGATGFIGSALVKRLAEEGVDLYCLIRKHSPNRFRLEDIPGITIIEVDSFHSTDLQRALQGISAEVVFNLVSYGVRQEEKDSELMLEINVNFLARLLFAVSQWPLKKFIHTGSCFEYGIFPQKKNISEDAPVRPRSLYGSAKAASVMYGNAFASYLCIPFNTLRLFGVFGTGEAPDRLIPYISDRLYRDEPVDLTLGEQIRDLLYIDDVAEAFIVSAQSDSLTPYTVYNVCSGIPTRIRDIGETVADMMNKPRDLLLWGKRAYRQDEPMYLVGDNRRFMEATRWKQRVSIHDGIKQMVETNIKSLLQGKE